MKRNTICILIAATACMGALQSVQAGEKERYLLGGLLGGWILNDVVSHSPHVSIHHEVRSRVEPCSPVIVEEPRHHHRPSGRYEYRQVKTWVPGHHERVVERCGRVVTRWIPGCYDIRTVKVWVSYGSHRSDRYDHGRHGSHHEVFRR